MPKNESTTLFSIALYKPGATSNNNVINSFVLSTIDPFV